MKIKRIVGMLAVLALCVALFAACESQKVEMDEEDDLASSLLTSETQVTPETESETESEPEVIVESETESESEPESEAEGTEEEVENDFSKEVLYAVRIDGFDINQGKLTVTMCEVPEGTDVNKLNPDDFTPGSQSSSLILPDNTKVMMVDPYEVVNVTLEEISTGIFAILDGNEDYMELYLYME